jgi:hypothetical protein
MRIWTHGFDMIKKSRLFRNINFTIGLFITLAILLTALISIGYTPYDPFAFRLPIGSIG